MVSQNPLFDISHLQDIRQTSEYAIYMHAKKWRIEMRSIGSLQIFLYIKKIPFTPFCVAKALRYHLPVGSAYTLPKPSRTYIFKDEPFLIENQQQSQIYFKVNAANSWPLTPTKTLWVDLTQPQNTLLANLQQKTRYNLKKAQTLPLQAHIIAGNAMNLDYLNQFYNLWSHNKPFNWLFRPQFNELKSLVESFGKLCFFVLVYDPLLFKEGQANGRGGLQAACLVLTSSTMAFYWHNTSSSEGKTHFAPTLCLWEALQEAKRRGLKVFDFEGLWDERYPHLNKGWKGFSRFKEGFVKS